MVPRFIVIVSQKSGSTFIQGGMAQHPDVFMFPGEVQTFESQDYEQGSLEALNRDCEKINGRDLSGRMTK